MSPENSEQKGIQLFEEGEYEQALPIFQDLVRLYPEDEKLNYYLGASLLETKNYGQQAKHALEIAKQGDVPDKISWYLGLVCHAGSDYMTALDYYAQFGKKFKE